MSYKSEKVTCIDCNTNFDGLKYTECPYCDVAGKEETAKVEIKGQGEDREQKSTADRDETKHKSEKSKPKAKAKHAKKTAKR